MDDKSAPNVVVQWDDKLIIQMQVDKEVTTDEERNKQVERFVAPWFLGFHHLHFQWPEGFTKGYGPQFYNAHQDRKCPRCSRPLKLVGGSTVYPAIPGTWSSCEALTIAYACLHCAQRQQTPKK